MDDVMELRPDNYWPEFDVAVPFITTMDSYL
jgi:hypothetical protein